MNIKCEFFSESNLDTIRENISAEILKITGIKIPLQKKESVFTIMRFCFTNYSLNSCDLEEINFLNKKCMDILIPNILSNMDQYIKYIKCIDSIENPQKNDGINILNYPQQTTSKRSENNKFFDYSLEFNKSLETIFQSFEN